MAFAVNAVQGATFTIQQNDWFRGRHIAVQPGGPGTQIMLPDDPLDGAYPNQPYFKMQVVGPRTGTSWFPNFNFPFNETLPAPSGVLPVTFGHSFPDPQGNVTFFAQAKMVSGQMTPLPGAKVDSFEAHDVHVGEVWDWQVTNLTHGDHPLPHPRLLLRAAGVGIPGRRATGQQPGELQVPAVRAPDDQGHHSHPGAPGRQGHQPHDRPTAHPTSTTPVARDGSSRRVRSRPSIATASGPPAAGCSTATFWSTRRRG